MKVATKEGFPGAVRCPVTKEKFGREVVLVRVNTIESNAILKLPHAGLNLGYASSIDQIRFDDANFDAEVFLHLVHHYASWVDVGFGSSWLDVNVNGISTGKADSEDYASEVIGVVGAGDESRKARALIS